ncbi:AMP-binding enzyme [Streptomyces sp. NBC_01390]|uniref:AMP-binding enzyme n=1 Tax=Streptomyces sp. NBC_01390 TaxID=2903850 RepID=UPI00386F80F7
MPRERPGHRRRRLVRHPRRGHLDTDGYLFARGRADDTTIRGGENIAPAETEAALQRHPDVHDAAVLGIPDDEWG